MIPILHISHKNIILDAIKLLWIIQQREIDGLPVNLYNITGGYYQQFKALFNILD